jgi:hypothetical protein
MLHGCGYYIRYGADVGIWNFLKTSDICAAIYNKYLFRNKNIKKSNIYIRHFPSVREVILVAYDRENIIMKTENN